MAIENQVIDAMVAEIEHVGGNKNASPLASIYFGGGTPSAIQAVNLEKLLSKIYSNFSVQTNAEITLEANPDDITKEILMFYKKLGINRISLGVQSFREVDLQLMNRSHTANQSKLAIELIQNAGFENFTIDLIYAIPGQSNEEWKCQLAMLTHFNVPHFSAYALTAEPKTLYDKQIKSGRIKAATDDQFAVQFEILCDFAQENGYDHYEISNFSQPNFQAVHNSNYWANLPYLGIGPSAHSYTGDQRLWNISNNHLYVKAINTGSEYKESEYLSAHNMFNEYLLTRLRTKVGLSINYIESNFAPTICSHLMKEISPFIKDGLIKKDNDRLFLSRNGMMISDLILEHLIQIEP